MCEPVSGSAVADGDPDGISVFGFKFIEFPTASPPFLSSSFPSARRLWFPSYPPWSALFPPYPPERTQPEITKGEAKAGGHHDPSRTGFAGVVLPQLAAQGDAADSRHGEENKACNLQPKLVQNPPERARRGSASANHGCQRPVAAGLLGCHSGQDAQLAG